MLLQPVNLALDLKGQVFRGHALGSEVLSLLLQAQKWLRGKPVL